MDDFDSLYRRWQDTPFPPRPDAGDDESAEESAELDTVDDLFGDLANWDAIVAEVVVPLAESDAPAPAEVDVGQGLADLVDRLEQARSSASVPAARELLDRYLAYCDLLASVHAAATAGAPTAGGPSPTPSVPVGTAATGAITRRRGTLPIRGPALDVDARHEAIVAVAFSWGRRRDLQRAGAAGAEIAEMDAAYAESRQAYAGTLPFVGLARCPFTGEETFHSIDPVALDGPWWDYHAPARPTEQLPRTWLAMPGALRVDRSVGRAPFVAKPGPAVPYVVRRMIEHPAVQAVICEVPVGHDPGWAVTYFAESRPEGLRLANTWGTDSYPVSAGPGAGWDSVPEWSPDNDYDLEPWLDRGKLHWIAPGDEKLRLRQGSRRCPYLGIEGSTEYGIVQNGSVRYPPPPPEAARHIRLT